MAFQQFKLDLVINQSRDIFDQYIYEPGNGDTIAEIIADNYFLESRFKDDWVGGVIQIIGSDGYIVGRIEETTVTILIESGGGGSGTTYGPLSNAGILAIAAPKDEETAFSTDDFIVYFFYSGSWYSTGGGVLS